ncbi:hypothetical protein WDU94_002947 [Cyamophila willieti]
MHTCSTEDVIQPILQVGATKKGFLICRRKSSISLYKLGRPTSSDVKHASSTISVCKIQSETFPFTSVDIYKREYVVANTERELRVFDIRGSDAKLEGILPRSPGCTYPNNWNSVVYWRGNSGMVMFADVCGVSAVDLKDGTISLVSFWCPRPYLESCERLSFLCQSTFTPDVWYVGTTHHLLGLDTRWTGDRGWVFRVSHHMNAVPMYCATKCVGTSETLVFGDQACNQVRSLVITWKTRSSNSRPFVSPYVSFVNTPLNTLHEARLKGELLSVGLTKRFDNNLNGLCFVPLSPVHPDNQAQRGLTLFSLRSSGDIFMQDMEQESVLKIRSQPIQKSEITDQDEGSLGNEPQNASQLLDRAQMNSTMGNESQYLILNEYDEQTVNETQLSDTHTEDLCGRLLLDENSRSGENLSNSNSDCLRSNKSSEIEERQTSDPNSNEKEEKEVEKGREEEEEGSNMGVADFNRFMLAAFASQNDESSEIEEGQTSDPNSNEKEKEVEKGREEEEEEESNRGVAEFNSMLAAFASQNEELGEENDIPAASQEDLFASPPKASSTQTPAFPPSPSLANQNTSLTQEQSEVTRSHSKSCRNESLSSRELSSLSSWCRELAERTSARQSPLWAGENVEFVDLFSPTHDLHHPLTRAPSDNTSTLLTNALADLTLSGLNVEILKCRDPIFESITTWSDDSSSEEGEDNRLFVDSINRVSQDSMNRSIEGETDERHLETIDADTMKELYLESDTDDESVSTRQAYFPKNARENPTRRIGNGLNRG